MKFSLSILLAAVALVISPASADTKTWRPCPTDDGAPYRCVWDAKHMGNGEGTSFLIRKGGKVVHIHHTRAHRLLKG